MISIENITKSYGSGGNRSLILKNISLTISEGSFTVILGASGSGKSTFLNVVSGLERPDGGSVIYGETDITKLSDTELTRFRRSDVGFVFQQYYLLPNMTVGKNIRMGADLANNREYKELADAVGLSDKLKKYPSELSGGE